MAEVKIIGQMDNTLDHTFESVNRVYDKNNLCPTLNTCGGGQLQPKVIEETRCVGGLSMSKWGTQYHQQDRVYKGDIALAQPANRRGRVQNDGDITPTITAEGSENINYIETEYRIRKLTPKECWRLMGYNDVDFDKAEKVNSNTQLYKQAGNAIVKQVLMAIFSQLNIKGVKAWNDMTETEKRAIIKKTTMAGE